MDGYVSFAPPLGLSRATVTALRARYGADHFFEYFASMSADELRSVLKPIDPTAMLLPFMGKPYLLYRLDWFARNEGGDGRDRLEEVA